jgi:hypothetical protein
MRILENCEALRGRGFEVEFYRLKPEGFIREYLFEAIYRTLIMFPVLLIINFVGLINFRSMINRNYPLFIFVIVIVPAVMLYYYSSYFRLKDCWESYLLTIDAGNIIRKISGLPKIYVAVNNVKKIIEDPDRGFIIQGPSGRQRFFVPLSLEKYEDIKSLIINSSADCKVIQKKIYFVMWFI